MIGIIISENDDNCGPPLTYCFPTIDYLSLNEYLMTVFGSFESWCYAIP